MMVGLWSVEGQTELEKQAKLTIRGTTCTTSATRRTGIREKPSTARKARPGGDNMIGEHYYQDRT